jgi:hypothetical protein
MGSDPVENLEGEVLWFEQFQGANTMLGMEPGPFDERGEGLLTGMPER